MTTDSLMTCAREGCEETYLKKTHNQKYHDEQCCKLATNQRIMKRYYRDRDRKSGKSRICAMCNITKLSRYNDSNICSGCELKKETETNSSVRNMMLSITWQV